MSLECSAWAFRQKMPLNAKCILLALADQADERTGRVCYGRTDMKYLAEKCAISVRSLWRYLGALVLNNYVRKESGKAEGKSSTFWLVLDRQMAKDLKDWHWNSVTEEATDDGELDDVEGVPSVAQRDSGDNDEIGVTPGVQYGVTARVSSLTSVHQAEPQSQNPATPVGFSREAQDLEREAGSIQQAAKGAQAKQFVIEGTRAWDAWLDYRWKKYGLRSAPTCLGTGQFANKRGWYFDGLFPPKSPTDPPGSLSTEDAKAFCGD